MKVGDLVKIKNPRSANYDLGLDGFYEFEVLFEDDVDWFSSLELENING